MIIYCLTNKINGKKYVGQTVNKLEVRFQEHCRKNVGAIGKAIKKYGKDNFNIEVIDSALLIDDLNAKEDYWVKSLNTLVPNGYNLCYGGGNTLGYRHREESRRMMSLTKRLSDKMKGKNNHFYGKKHTEETRQKMSNRWKSGERIMTDEQKKKLRDAHVKKKVLNKTTGKTFDSIKEAAEYYDMEATHITRVCRGKRKSAKGFEWEYIQ